MNLHYSSAPLLQGSPAEPPLRAGEAATPIKGEVARLRGRAMDATFILGQEAERQRLARELHDVLSQKLAGVGIELSLLGQHPPSSSVALRKSLQCLGEQINELAGDVHRMSRRLHPAIVQDLGLVAALESECEAFSRQRGLPVKLFAPERPMTIPSEISLCLYRVAQECLRNIARHAGEARVTVTLSANAREVGLCVQDTGKGFRPEMHARKGGIGLVSMEERVGLVNGRFSVVSQPGEGARVEVRIPLRRRRRA